MKNPVEIPFQEVIDALLDGTTRFNPRYLYRLSDLKSDEAKLLASTWGGVPLWRRQALMEDIEELGVSDYLLSFEAVGRIAIQDADPVVRQLGVRTLWEFEERDLIRIFIDLMTRDDDAKVRAAAVSGLGQFVYLGEIEELPRKTLERIENILLKVVNSNDVPLVRHSALESLGYSTREEVPPLIEAAYASDEKEWQASSLFAMGRSANDTWHAKVSAMLDHPIPKVREEAVRAAGELEMKNAREVLLTLLEDDNDDVRMAAVWSLSKIGGEGVREKLEKLQRRTRDREDREYLEAALDNLSFSEEMAFVSLIDLEGEAEEADLSGMEDLLEDDLGEDSLFDDEEELIEGDDQD